MEKQISNFFLVVDGMVKSIDALKSVQYEGNYKRLALFSLMDMLSKAVISEKDIGNRQRMVKFILDFCDWDHGNRISLQQLILIMDKDPSGNLNKLKDYAKETIRKWPRSQAIHLDKDPEYEEISGLWPKGHRIKGEHGKITLESFRHVELFYSLRNSFIHELRPRGHYSHFFDEETNPYYAACRGKVETYEDGSFAFLPYEEFELIHPLSFHFDLVNNAIKNMRDFCLVNNINPYDSFEFSSEWIDVKL